MCLSLFLRVENVSKFERLKWESKSTVTFFWIGVWVLMGWATIKRLESFTVTAKSHVTGFEEMCIMDYFIIWLFLEGTEVNILVGKSSTQCCFCKLYLYCQRLRFMFSCSLLTVELSSKISLCHNLSLWNILQLMRKVRYKGWNTEVFFDLGIQISVKVGFNGGSQNWGGLLAKRRFSLKHTCFVFHLWR